MDTVRYQEVLGMVNELYALTGAGKWDDVADRLTDDFRILEAASLPFGGEYLGKGALQELYTKVFTYWDEGSLELHDITVSENNVVALLSFHAKSKVNGERLTMKIAEVFHLRGQKFCGITPYYFDTRQVGRATGHTPA